MNPSLDRSSKSILSSCACRCGMQPGSPSGMRSGMQSGMPSGVQSGVQSGMQTPSYGTGQAMASSMGPCGDGLHRGALLDHVYRTGFAVDDALLFLDTHPSDKAALPYYGQAQAHYSQAVQAYEAQCGPLFMTNVTDRNYWTWINDPWPWEGGCI